MAEDLVIKIESDFKELQNKAKETNLSPAQAEQVNTSLKAAQMALNAKDWKTFQSNFNNVLEILKTAIASSGKISQELQKNVKLQEDVRKNIERLKNEQQELKNKVTDSGKPTRSSQESFYKGHEKYNQVKDATGKQITDYATVDKTTGALKDDTLLYKVQEITKALADMGKGIQSVTDEMAKSYGFQNRQAVFAANAITKDASTEEARNLKRSQEIGPEIEQEEKDLAQLEEEAKKFQTAADSTAEGLEALYEQVVKLGKALNTEVSEQRRAERPSGGGGEGVSTNAALDVNNTTQALNKQSTSLGKAFKQFSIYAIALRTVKKALQDAVKTVKDLDKYLTEQAMVTGKTRKETYALLGAYQNMASELGATTKEVAEVTTQFLRQGKSTADALTLTRAAVSAAKVAGISGAESVNYLTTALNGFQLAAEDAMKVSDKFAAIAATSATSYQEIATALSKVASQANIAGMSIDFTTALLAKGIETTREPAESIGTALKTIIARMRELTDYGKTLEDGMNINNVETQLAYVGIALRNANGELRSTEEVLNELGSKWETFSSNQQAAVAKALAGTRQQSRLIAMMQDYERVTELQEIAQRSAGATAAQAATYMEGMEAALNKVNVAWEKIVTAVTNSDIIIGFIEGVSNAMDHLGAFLESSFGIVSTMITIAAIGLTIIGRKMMEMQLARQQNQLTVERQKRELEDQRIAALSYKAKQKSTTEELKQKAIKAKNLVIDKQQVVAELQKRKAKGENVDKELELANLDLQKAERDYAAAELEVAKSEAADYTLNTYKQQNALLQSQSGLLGQLGSSLTFMITPLTSIIGLYKKMAQGINGVIAKKRAEEAQTKKNAGANMQEAGGSMANSAGKIPYVGWIIAAGILIAMGIAAGAAIAALTSKMNNTGANKAADEINNLSNEIYKLQEKANAIKTIEKQYDALDKKIVQTTEDQKKMNELLDQAGDKLSSENQKDGKGNEVQGSSEQDIYKNLQSEKAKREYLAKIEEDSIRKANAKRREQLRILEELDPAQRKLMLTSKDNADYLMAQDAIYAINNNTLYEYIDTLGDVGENVEALTQKILEQMDAQEAYEYASDRSGSKIKQLADAINSANTIIGDSQVSLAEVLDSTKYSFEEKIKAYNDLYAAIDALGDDTALEAFKDAYGQWAQLQEAMSPDSIKFMDRIGISIDKLNNFGQALNKLGLETEEATRRISELFDAINSGADLSSSITRVFSDILKQYTPGSDEYNAVYNSILNAYQNAAGTGLLNMGQNLKSLQSQINSLYETASKWSTMSKDEQTSFIQDNYELFKGEGGADLFEAFQTGNYKEIQAALAKNEVLKEQIGLRLEQLKIDLQIAEAATDRNEAEIAWLKEQIKALETYEDEMSSVYQADLKLRLEQEDKQLELYKDYLEKQKDALTESLDERKEAYQKYFDTINQEAEDQDYEENAAILMANLSKLSSSTDAGSRQQAKELEQQLQELEKERLETLRERAQEAVLNNLDNEVSQINDKFDKLLENNAALLDAMNKEIAADPSDFISRLATSGIENMTATQAEDFIKNSLIPTYDSSISSDILDGIKVRQEGSSLFLTLNNQEIELSNNNQQELSTTILAALRAMGISI